MVLGFLLLILYGERNDLLLLLLDASSTWVISFWLLLMGLVTLSVLLVFINVIICISNFPIWLWCTRIPNFLIKLLSVLSVFGSLWPHLLFGYHVILVLKANFLSTVFWVNLNQVSWTERVTYLNFKFVGVFYKFAFRINKLSIVVLSHWIRLVIFLHS